MAIDKIDPDFELQFPTTPAEKVETFLHIDEAAIREEMLRQGMRWGGSGADYMG